MRRGTTPHQKQYENLAILGGGVPAFTPADRSEPPQMIRYLWITTDKPFQEGDQSPLI